MQICAGCTESCYLTDRVCADSKLLTNEEIMKTPEELREKVEKNEPTVSDLKRLLCNPKSGSEKIILGLPSLFFMTMPVFGFFYGFLISMVLLFLFYAMLQVF